MFNCKNQGSCQKCSPFFHVQEMSAAHEDTAQEGQTEVCLKFKVKKGVGPNIYRTLIN